MRRLCINLSMVLLAMLIITGTASAIDIGQIIHKINPDHTTRDSREDYWKTMKGKQVVWTGKVHDVLGGFRGVYKVFVQVGRSEVGKYNVILTVKDQPRIARLKDGTTIRFTGNLQRYKWTHSKPVTKPDGAVKFVRQFVIYLDNGYIYPGKGR